MKDGFHLCAIYEDTSSKRGFIDGPKVAQPAGGGAGPAAGTGAPPHPCIPLPLSQCMPSAPGESLLIVAAMSSCFPSSLCICMLRGEDGFAFRV